MQLIKQVTINGKPAAKVRMSDGEMRYFAPARPAPLRVDGMPVVGQFSSKFIRPDWKDKIADNADPASHIDVDAWMRAFAEVYAAS